MLPLFLFLRPERLRPIDVTLVCEVGEVRKAHLPVLRTHDVDAVSWTVEPSSHDDLGGRGADGDVLSHVCPVVSGTQRTHCWRTAIGAAMLEELVRAHVLGMRERGTRQDR